LLNKYFSDVTDCFEENKLHPAMKDDDKSEKNHVSFEDFCGLCRTIANESSYNSKTELVKEFIDKRSINGEFQGDLYILVKLLLPAIQKRVYNLKDKQIVKLFSQVFAVSGVDMVTDLEKGNVSQTVKDFFQKSEGIKPRSKSILSINEVDQRLEELSSLTKEEDQLTVLKKITKSCTVEDLKFIVRLIKHDLRMNAGAKHVLDALDANAYAAYQASSDLKEVVKKLNKAKTNIPGLKKTLSIRASVMTPVKPMLAEACKSTAMAMKKCPNGMYAEIKYDGERVQVHKQGSKFDYFSRSLKPVQAHKVSEIKDYLPKACPSGDNLILDGEILLVDNTTGKPLPFGTLGIHKKSKFHDATVCYVIFDILQFNEENVMKKPIKDRRDILVKNVNEIKGRIMLSEMTHITRENELKRMLDDAFADNLEGLVLKDLKSIYEPGKRHWLKMKKDYLHDGAMADTADLVVLGAYYGTGNKGGIMSVFLMGCFDPKKDKWVTVAKCGNGHDDKALAKIQKQLKVTKIGKDFSKVPVWLEISKSLVPDFVVSDPKGAPVWEITGAEFSQSTTHTANGISIRFPRVTRVRNDKDWKTATDLQTLQQLYENSKSTKDDKPSSDSRKRPATEESEDYSSKRVKELPTIFRGLKISISDNVDDIEKMKRYIIAYDGDIVDSYHINEATHHITNKLENIPAAADLLFVKPDWIWTSITTECLQPEENFLFAKKTTDRQ